MLKVSRLYIYPIKSLAGIAVNSAEVTQKGFKFDRRYMLVDEKNNFLTIREFPQLVRLQCNLLDNGISVNNLNMNCEDLIIEHDGHTSTNEKVTIWNASVDATIVSKEVNVWFSDILKSKVKLVYMPQATMRPVDTTSGYKPEDKFVSFADAYPFMIMGESSLDDLNTRVQGKQIFGMDRFRPNIVFSGGTPNQEDTFEDFSINGVQFKGLENCARCTIPTVDPKTGVKDPNSEPLLSLSKYRLQNRKINFGRNVVHSGIGVVHVGDQLKFQKII